MITVSWIKRIIVGVTFFVACYSTGYGQNELIDQYLKETGDYAHIYSGELEANYNPFLFENNPYYGFQEYDPGEVIYRGNLYTNQHLRWDLYKKNLVVLTPQSHLGVILNARHVSEFRMHGRTFVHFTPPKDSGLKQGYYAQLFKGEKLLLLGYHTVNLESVTGKIEKRFAFINRYYILMNGTSYLVRNTKSFTKLFPEYKKQIKRYVKDNSLSFSKDRENSLIQLAQYMEEIINPAAL